MKKRPATKAVFSNLLNFYKFLGFLIKNLILIGLHKSALQFLFSRLCFYRMLVENKKCYIFITQLFMGLLAQGYLARRFGFS